MYALRRYKMKLPTLLKGKSVHVYLIRIELEPPKFLAYTYGLSTYSLPVPAPDTENRKNGYRFCLSVYYVHDSQILPLRLTGKDAINFQLFL